MLINNNHIQKKPWQSGQYSWRHLETLSWIQKSNMSKNIWCWDFSEGKHLKITGSDPKYINILHKCINNVSDLWYYKDAEFNNTHPEHRSYDWRLQTENTSTPWCHFCGAGTYCVLNISGILNLTHIYSLISTGARWTHRSINKINPITS